MISMTNTKKTENRTNNPKWKEKGIIDIKTQIYKILKNG